MFTTSNLKKPYCCRKIDGDFRTFSMIFRSFFDLFSMFFLCFIVLYYVFSIFLLFYVLPFNVLS